jgi:hypothetical protein
MAALLEMFDAIRKHKLGTEFDGDLAARPEARRRTAKLISNYFAGESVPEIIPFIDRFFTKKGIDLPRGPKLPMPYGELLKMPPFSKRTNE